MTKKQIFLAIGLGTFLVIIMVAATSYFLFFKSGETAFSNNASEGGVAGGNLSPGGSVTIPLGEKTTETSSSGLSVDDSSQFNANLGSGSTAISGSNSSNSSSSTEDFTQYAQYKDKNEVFFGEIVEGTGAVAQKDSQLAVAYKGYLTNGSMFDQSRVGANGQVEPLMFKLGAGQLIPGFEQGVAGMKVGGTRRIVIPPSLGYGDTAQNNIPANSVLIFDVQLLAAQ